MRADRSYTIDELHLCGSKALYFEPDDHEDDAKTDEEQMNPVVMALCILIFLIL